MINNRPTRGVYTRGEGGEGHITQTVLHKNTGSGSVLYTDDDEREWHAKHPPAVGWLSDAIATIYDGTAHPGDADAVIQRLSNHS